MSPEDGGGTPPPTEIVSVEAPEPPVLSEKATTRRYLAYAMTGIVAVLFLCLSVRYLLFSDTDDRQDFIHLFEILLTVHGTILGFYFGSQDY
jgi:heme/copper-type cytochrome/quinol oxidase subunit 1